MSTKVKLTSTTSASTASVSVAEGRDGGAESQHGSIKTEGGGHGSSARGSVNEDSRHSDRSRRGIDAEMGVKGDVKEVEGTVKFCRIYKEDEGRGEEEPLGVTEDNLKPRLSQAKRQWSIQAVKGKVTTSCLWNACKALTIGTILIFIGAGMATIGYYAEEANLRRLQNITEGGTESVVIVNQVSMNKTTSYWRPPQIVGSNGPRTRPRPPPAHAVDANFVLYTNTTSVGPKATKNIPVSSFGLNKLSYVGPIVMGIGGFVIVAACVMTFEARDSAAKIVPARFRKPFPERAKPEDTGVRHSAAQTKWETLGVYEAELIRFHHEKELNRRALTSAFIRFSKNIQSSMDSTTEYYELRGGPRTNLVKCPSAPSLIREFHHEERKSMEAPRILRVSAFPRPPPRRRLSSNAYPRQTMSVDNPAVREVYTAGYQEFIGEKGDEDMELGASATGVHRVDSDASLALDLHLPKCAVTLSVRDSSRSPSGHTDHEEVSANTPLLEQVVTLPPQEEIAGPSGVSPLLIPLNIEPLNHHPKVDKQTSTSDHNHMAMMGWSRDTLESKEHSSSREKGGGSFREAKRPKAVRKVKRSETIDTASHSHRKSHNKSHRSRSGSIRSPHESRRLTPTRSETARKHQLLRQPKVDGTEVHDDV